MVSWRDIPYQMRKNWSSQQIAHYLRVLEQRERERELAAQRGKEEASRKRREKLEAEARAEEKRHEREQRRDPSTKRLGVKPAPDKKEKTSFEKAVEKSREKADIELAKKGSELAKYRLKYGGVEAERRGKTLYAEQQAKLARERKKPKEYPDVEASRARGYAKIFEKRAGAPLAQTELIADKKRYVVSAREREYVPSEVEGVRQFIVEGQRPGEKFVPAIERPIIGEVREKQSFFYGMPVKKEKVKEYYEGKRLELEFQQKFMQPMTKEGIPYIYDPVMQQTRPAIFQDLIIDGVTLKKPKKEKDLGIEGFDIVGRYAPTEYQKAGLKLIPLSPGGFVVDLPETYPHSIKGAGFDPTFPIVGESVEATYQEERQIELGYRLKMLQAKTEKEKIVARIEKEQQKRWGRGDIGELVKEERSYKGMEPIKEWQERLNRMDIVPGADVRLGHIGRVGAKGIFLSLGVIGAAGAGAGLLLPTIKGAGLGVAGYVASEPAYRFLLKRTGSPLVATIGSIATFTGIASAPAIGKMIKTKVLPPITKRISKKYIPPEKMPYGLKLKPIHTDPITKGRLIKEFGEKKSILAHTTEGLQLKVGEKSPLLAFPEMAKGWRTRAEALGYYESLPAFDINKAYIRQLLGRARHQAPIPTLPKTNLIQSQLLAFVKKEKATVGGGYALKTFYKKLVRNVKDLDIIAEDPRAFAYAAKAHLTKLRGTKFSVIKSAHAYRLYDVSRQRFLGDIVPPGLYHELKLTDIAVVKGVKIVKPEHLLKSKLYELAVKDVAGIKVKPKVYKDIETILGKGIEYKRIVQKTPQAYTAYLSETTPLDYPSSMLETRFSLFGPKRQIYIRQAKVKHFKPRKGETLLEYNQRIFRKQMTHLPGENILEMSIERQTTSPPAVTGKYRGMEIKAVKDLGFTYEQLMPKTPDWLKKIPGGERLDKLVRGQQLKTYLQEVEVTPIKEDFVPPSNWLKNLKSYIKKSKIEEKKLKEIKPKTKTKPPVDLGKYASSYGRTRYITLPSIISKSVGFGGVAGTLAASSTSLSKALKKSFSVSVSKAPSVSKSRVVSYAPSKSSISRSMGVSPSKSYARSVSPSISKSVSPSISKSISISKSVSPSKSLSVSPSISVSPSVSVSSSISPSISVTTTFRPPFPPPPKLKPRPKLPKPEAEKKQGYNVFVKRKQAKKGKGNYLTRGYKKANIKPLTKESAFLKGATVVDKYTNRSFTVMKADKPAKADAVNPQVYNFYRQKFRRKKGNKNIYVEKTKHAIDSFEEKQGIPYESLRLRKAGLLNIKPRRRKRK